MTINLMDINNILKIKCEINKNNIKEYEQCYDKLTECINIMHKKCDKLIESMLDIKEFDNLDESILNINNQKCQCGNLYSLECINKQCGHCCNTLNCIKHNNKQSQNNDIESDTESEINICEICKNKCNDADGWYKCTDCEHIYCDNCKPYCKYDFRCQTKNCSYCRYGRCNNNRWGDDYYCSDCFDDDLNDEIEQCIKCEQNVPYHEYWKCTSCDDVICYDCSRGNRRLINECHFYGCIYCIMGTCRYVYLDNDAYCDECYESSDDESDDDSSEENNETPYDSKRQLDKTISDLIRLNIKTKNFTDLENMCNIKITFLDKLNVVYDNTIQCSLCYDNIVNCQVSCGHIFCVNCYFENNQITGSTCCAICRELLDNNIILLL